MVKDLTGIKIVNAALAEAKDGSIILRGDLDWSSLDHLKVDDYQREVLAASGSGGRSTSRIRKGIDAGARLPDIELGMRGQNFTTHGRSIILHDPVYIIDGLQRVSAMKGYLEAHDGVSNGAMPIGATVNFKTTKQWEKDRFADLNQLRTPLSPGVLLRNARDKHPSILTLYGLSRNDPSFALYQRVGWDQRMKQQEIIKGLMMVRAAMAVHRNVHERIILTRGSTKRGEGEVKINKGASHLDRIAKEIGLQNFRENMKDFFELIDECWGIRNIEYGEAQGHLRGAFLMALGGFFANNTQLWDAEKKRLHIERKLIPRFKAFPINDPEIRRLCGSGTNTAVPILYNYLLDHMNKRLQKGRFK